MSSQLAADKTNARAYQCETLEERLALTVQALSDLPEIVQAADLGSAPQTTALTGVAAPSSQIEYVRENFQLAGEGQTVAIIDTGIAWDHYALGGGLGKDFRVVGGWDFAENDADPFDDGPAGFHGTHVAGIVGSDDPAHEGVAAKVDLVGLRVFDDMGNGKLEWVEQALQWVHQNRNRFENPITTVNLSLGLNWNADTVPNWATLEDEFRQLKNDGIFISVAAGNSFQKYLTSGVSYPAASSNVVPVASHDAKGNLSDFSQRNGRVLVAPGENISSTIPAHLLGQRGASSRFMEASGTSMAAPFVAGSSVLLREAFELAGRTGINQNLLYAHFQKTADEVYDTVTHSWYSRLNLKAAIEAALEDGHGDTRASATRLENVSRLDSFRGILAKSGDVDFFRFRADQSGTVSLRINDSHDLETVVRLVGQSYVRDGNTIRFDVQAGQEYALRFNAASGQGNYRVNVTFEESMPVNADLGMVRSNLISGMSNSGETFYRLTAARNGILTIETLTQNAGNGFRFEVYDATTEQLVAASSGSTSGGRADMNVRKGDVLIVKIIGDNNEFDLRLTNLVRTVGSRIIAGGTGQADSYSYRSGTTHQITVNGTQYEFSRDHFDKVRIHGGSGRDSVQLIGSDQAETLTGGSGNAIFYGGQTDAIAKGFESINVIGNGGLDRAVLNDTSSADFYRGTSTRSELTGGGFYLVASDFDRVTVVSGNGGNDRAELVGTSGSDFLHIHQDGTSMAGDGYQNYVIGFEQINADGRDGNDRLVARGSSNAESAKLVSNGLQYRNIQGYQVANGFDDITVKSGGGQDQAQIIGLTNQDQLTRSGSDIQGLVSGSQILLEGYNQVDWEAEVGQSPDVALAAIESIFDDYAQD